MLTKKVYMTTNLIETLNLRTQFEELTKDYRFPQPYSGSDINTLNWFIKEGHKSNSLRTGYDQAKKIAKTIIKEYHGSEKTTKRFSIR